ncbi:CidA/LrgA family protein [Brachyspira hampsonii]|uniref:CidA/LrgA family protein n=1 Tax=Brachyspira hampsonii TaxID=1287055 RepID=A0AAC9TS12_9SPIR|nr:CidA/LrgA family protein [Brachyspira hampsonii]ASJ20950.1 CidA/LrgA family protein [Brachyspira hampsonii]ELV05780.1 effector of murein hydrolase LrgA [Brachyspira hampsonii 30599]MBW5380716.1 CidA/LrgA family protein [Brachyspira hampsonii]MBW5389652.1 CidA/LrgA family protein [Brachyspira hampsonii]OEJ13320.1 hydrogenase [Brachyspira hampsonii]
MKLIKQFTIIFSIYSIADIFSKTLRLPIPGNVIGMILLFVLLALGIIKENHIDEASDLLIANMSMLFIPGTLAIIDEYKYVKAEIIPFVIICLLLTIIIMVITGLSAQSLEKIFSKIRKSK